ncbi:MAG: stressosome-associated protein Prli42 [Bacilli bacterium]
MNPKVQKFMVYLMLFVMLVSTALTIFLR